MFGLVYADPALRSPEPITVLSPPILACPPVTIFSPASTPKSANCKGPPFLFSSFFYPFFYFFGDIIKLSYKKLPVLLLKFLNRTERVGQGRDELLELVRAGLGLGLAGLLVELARLFHRFLKGGGLNK